MRSNNSPLTYDELWAFFRVVDTDEDGRISYSELLEAITFVPNYFSQELRRSALESQLRQSRDNQFQSEVRDL